jgi:hypothetical protein
MNSIAPKSVLRDVLIGFGVGLVLMISLTLASNAAAVSFEPANSGTTAP